MQASDDLAGYFLRLIITAGWQAALFERLARMHRAVIERLDEVEREGMEAAVFLAVMVEHHGGELHIPLRLLEEMNGKHLQRRDDQEHDAVVFRVIAPR